MPYRTAKEWEQTYRAVNALWTHDGNPERPHALLTSGKHSDGFFNSELVMENAWVVADVCANIITRLQTEADQALDAIDRVVGPAMGAITIAHELARQLSQETGRRVTRAYTEKEVKAGVTCMVFSRTSIKKGERVLLCEDVLTTGGSIDMAAEAVEKACGIVIPHVAIIVNRSGLLESNGRNIVALINKTMHTWEPHDCPLCKKGSKALRPKGVENWNLLNADY